MLHKFWNFLRGAFPLFAVVSAWQTYDGWSGLKWITDIEAHGAPVKATIERAGTTTNTRSKTKTYTVDLSWTDRAGSRQYAKEIPITDKIADHIIARKFTTSWTLPKNNDSMPERRFRTTDEIVAETLDIKYLAGQEPLILEDAAALRQNYQYNLDEYPPLLAFAIAGTIVISIAHAILMRRASA